MVCAAAHATAGPQAEPSVLAAGFRGTRGPAEPSESWAPRDPPVLRLADPILMPSSVTPGLFGHTPSYELLGWQIRGCTLHCQPPSTLKALILSGLVRSFFSIDTLAS